MKNIKISDEGHKKIKEYCKERCLKMGAFIEQVCLQRIELDLSKEDKSK